MNRNIAILRKCLLRYSSTRTLSSKLDTNENEPIKFTTSRAAGKTLRPVLNKKIHEMPWYQPYSVIASVSLFLLYFCVLREENDVDLEFTKTLYERIHGLEKEQLIQSYKYNIEHGKDVTEIEKRLKELDIKQDEVV